MERSYRVRGIISRWREFFDSFEGNLGCSKFNSPWKQIFGIDRSGLIHRGSSVFRYNIGNSLLLRKKIYK